jgi:hypothetical protein
MKSLTILTVKEGYKTITLATFTLDWLDGERKE